MATLGIMPAQYYDLTGPETEALMQGANEKEINEWRRTRLIGVLLRNAHFKDPETAEKFLPLPGDDELIGNRENTPEEAFYALATAMGCEIQVSDN